jgi:histidinol-phosphate aminotransferase
VLGASILAPTPGFVMYAMSAQLQGLAFHGVPLTADFELDVVAMLGAIAKHRPSITYLAYPNNPTANLWNDGAIAKIIAAVGEQGGLVVMDEAYQPFAARSWLEQIRANPAAHSHVLLMRTLSKFGLAGVRIGYMMGPKALIAEIDKVRPPYNISVLNYECALFALEHAGVFAAQAEEIKAQRAIILEALSVLPGVRAWNSQANMILLRVPDAQKTFDGMKARKVLVKNVSKMHPLLANCLRLTVGTAEENRQMLAALKESL